MKKLTLLMAGVACGALLSISPAHAVLIADGITYDLEEQTVNATTREFVLKITGENTASDTEKGRTGINAIAFGTPSNFSTATMSAPSGFVFVAGGLNSGGCDGSGAFFCFDNTAIPPTPTTALSGTLTFDFEVAATTGHTIADPLTTAFKIDWVGTKNNYDLVSKDITADATCPDCTINPVSAVPEPGTLAIFGSALLGLGAVCWFRRRKDNGIDGAAA